MPRLLEARWVRDFVLSLPFIEGSEGEVDLSGELDGPIFEPLRDPVYFRQFTLSPRVQGRNCRSWDQGLAAMRYNRSALAR